MELHSHRHQSTKEASMAGHKRLHGSWTAYCTSIVLDVVHAPIQLHVLVQL